MLVLFTETISAKRCLDMSQRKNIEVESICFLLSREATMSDKTLFLLSVNPFSLVCVWGGTSGGAKLYSFREQIV